MLSENLFAISQYHNAKGIHQQLDELIEKPIYSISRARLKFYEQEYYQQRCRKSKELADAAKNFIPLKNLHNAPPHPFALVFAKAQGAYLWDIDGNRYFDFLQAGGSTILGANPIKVRKKIIELLENCGPSLGLFHEYEYNIARKINSHIPSVEMFCMLDAKNNAVTAALRVARVASRKKKIIKLSGTLHGWSDQLVYSFDTPATHKAQGIPFSVYRHTQEFFSNHLQQLEKKMQRNQWQGGTAAVLIEALGAQNGTQPLQKDFHRGVEKLCRKYGALFILDESVTAFRIGMSGAQGYFGISPDLTIFGNSIAGGYSGVAGLGGKKEYMQFLSADITPNKRKVFLGENSDATPLSCAAALYTIEEIERTNAIQKSGEMGDRLTLGLQQLADKYNIPFVAFNQGSICHLETTAPLNMRVTYSKFWKIPSIKKQILLRQQEMNYMATAYFAEGLVTDGGNCFYTNAAYDIGKIDLALKAFSNVLAEVKIIEAK